MKTGPHRHCQFKANTLEDRWILSRFNRSAKEVNEALETFRFHEAANRIYDFFWGEFCDWYLELIKPRLNFETSRQGAASGLRESGELVRSITAACCIR